jgi:methionyl-tRNA synthetase
MLIEQYGVDAIRFFLLREGTFGLDSDFSHKALIHRINSDLANDLGNLFNRSLAMTFKYCEGRVPQPSTLEEIDEHLRETALQVKNQVDLHMENIALHKSLDAIWKLVRMTNKYIDETAPWSLAKDTNQHKRLATAIHTMLESLRFITTLLFPFMPTSAEAMWRALGCSETLAQYTISNGTQWGRLTPGTPVTKIPPLFPRREA